MPVGCLGNTSSSSDQKDLKNHPSVGSHLDEGGGGNGNNSMNEMEVFITSSVLNAAEQFAFMQHTLLLQIFRESGTSAKAENDNSMTRYFGPGGIRLPNGNNGLHRQPPLSTEQSTLSGSISPNAFSNSSSMSSPSPSSSPLPTSSPSSCPTCIAFNDGQCCQNENGISLFQEFKHANVHCYWDGKLSDAIASLRYQGYVCPGILILIAGSSQLEMVADAWQRKLLSSPPNCRICQVGLSNGCVVKPLIQNQSISLPDILCLVLSRMKHQQQIADIDSICGVVEQDWSSNVISRILLEGGKENLKDTVHAALGCLIKARKVYYTGNKGYFLVSAVSVNSQSSNKDTSTGQGGSSWENSSNGGIGRLGSLSSQLRHSLRNRSTSWGSSKNSNGSTKRSKSIPKMVDQECQTLLSDLPSRFPLTHSVDSDANNLRNTTTSPSLSNGNGHGFASRNQAHKEENVDYDPVYAIPNNLGANKSVKSIPNDNIPGQATNVQMPSNTSFSSNPHNVSIETYSSGMLSPSKSSPPCSVPNTYRNYNLERSQSLRISRKSQRSISSASKGGSLRLSKKEAERLKELQLKAECENATNDEPHYSAVNQKSPIETSTATSPQQYSENSTTTSSKEESKGTTFERKNSFLGKLFGGSGNGKKKTSGSIAGSEKSSTSTSSIKKDTKLDKRKIVTFSAQFPPPELIELSNPIYTALIKKPKPENIEPQEPEETNPSNTQAHSSTSTSLSRHQGPNGNFVMYEKRERTNDVHDCEMTPPGTKNTSSISVYGCHPHTLKVNVLHSKDSNVYGYASVGSLDMTGGSIAGPQSYKKQLPQSPPTALGVPRHIRPPNQNMYNSPENYYNTPPPPLPYRPPPPNPYLTPPQYAQAPSNKHSTASPTNMVEYAQINQPKSTRPQLSHPGSHYINTSTPPLYDTLVRHTPSTTSPLHQSKTSSSIMNQDAHNSSILTSSNSHGELSIQRSSNNNRVGITRNVRFADENESSIASSSADATFATIVQHVDNENTFSNGSTSNSGSSSGPSSMESQTTKPLFDKTLVVIERSNNELELNLNRNIKYATNGNGVTTNPNYKQSVSTNANTNATSSAHALLVSKILSQPPPQTLPSNAYVGRIGRQLRSVDTIHNNRNLLSPEEIIYEIDNINISDSDLSHKPIPQNNTQNERNNSYNNINNNGFLRSPSKPAIKPCSMIIEDRAPSTSSPSAAPSYPSLSDLSIVNDETSHDFKSLTAQKLMAGLSFNSIDTLLEVNAAAEARNKLNESTETVDFGVI